MFDLKKILELKKTMTETKKRLDAMVIKETSPKGLFELTISGSQKVSEVKILKDLAGCSNEEIEKDLKERIEYMKSLAKKVEKRSPETVREYSDRLYEKIKEVLSGKDVDEARILTEVAIFADRVAITEEIVRLKSHIRQFRAILEAQQPVGRKLDFLVQEFNREANTIASKANDFELAKIVVDVKAEIEKIREQVQNIE